MDLDALGLNSTFESTEIDEKHQPKVDVVETSDIEGPDDFTMNMTYWMTTDLPLAQQLRSRKEAKANISGVRGDVISGKDSVKEHTNGNGAVLEERSRAEGTDTASPTVRVNDVIRDRSSSKAPSEQSMENEEKVRSYLSALPDTDMGEHVLASTPLRIPKQNMLQVPSPSPNRARSLQPTVEDYDTPRKPTQETVIHHPPLRTAEIERDDLQRQVAELQSRLEIQESSSKKRITELETLLSYTRSDLETARTEMYKQKDQISKLNEENGRHRHELEASHESARGQAKRHEEELFTRMQELGEELRLQNLARLQTQREDFEKQLRALEEAKRAMDDDMAARGELLKRVQSELRQLRQSHEHELRSMKGAEVMEEQRNDDSAACRDELQQKLDSLQARATALELDLQQATAEARSAREEGRTRELLHASAEEARQAESARAVEFQSRIILLQSQLDSAQADIRGKDQQLQAKHNVESQMQSLQVELDRVRAQQNTNGQPVGSQAIQLESRLHSLQVRFDAACNDVAIKNKEIVRYVEEQERCEERLNTAQGRVESLEMTISTLRQQLAEAHRSSAKAHTDAEQFEALLEDANERLQDARAEADRRVVDVEKKLGKLKDAKADMEAKLKQAQAEVKGSREHHETEMDNVRDKAEDAVRKAGSLLEQERSEKKRILKEMKRLGHELEQMRAEAARKAGGDESSDGGTSGLESSMHNDPKDVEIENLRSLVRKQASALRSLKQETTLHRNASLYLESQSTERTHLESTVAALRSEINALKAEAIAREQNFEATNRAMDERLAGLLSQKLKERAKNVVGMRDGQWMERCREDREFVGRVLMREWGKQEVGVAEQGEAQGYRYRYVKRE